MARFAPVAPIQILEALYEQSPQTFGTHHLLLAHHTVAEADRFHRLFARIEHDRIIRPTVIMDNSIVELGGSVDFEMVRDAVNVVAEACENAIVVPVLPDVMGKGQETREAVGASYDRWSREMPGNGFMAVAQGESFADYAESLEFFDKKEYGEITWIGIPRILVKTLSSREPATAYATSEFPNYKYHLLGFSDNMVDDIHCATRYSVETIDSAVPLRIKEAFHPGLVPAPRDPAWFEEGQLDHWVLKNLDLARMYVDFAPR